MDSILIAFYLLSNIRRGNYFKCLLFNKDDNIVVFNNLFTRNKLKHIILNKIIII